MEKDISKDFLIEIGGNIKEKRKKRKMTMEELGLEIGLTRMQVNRIEKGYNITMITLLKLSIALEVKLEQLVRVDYKYGKDELERLINNKVNKNKTSKR